MLGPMVPQGHQDKLADLASQTMPSNPRTLAFDGIPIAHCEIFAEGQLSQLQIFNKEDGLLLETSKPERARFVCSDFPLLAKEQHLLHHNFRPKLRVPADSSGPATQGDPSHSTSPIRPMLFVLSPGLACIYIAIFSALFEGPLNCVSSA